MRRLVVSTLFLTLLRSIAGIAQSNSNPYAPGPYKPVSYHIGTESPSKPADFQQCQSASPYTLKASRPVLSLDYGSEVAGFPYVDISSFDGEYAQIELKYSEPYDGLSLPYGDGPWYDPITK
jgi:hypothetical protein